MNQRERLRYLADYFKNESDEYRNITVPEDQEGQGRLLRSLMNARMPGKIEVKPLDIQDAYLSERIRENGIVSGEEIPVYKDKHVLYLELGVGDNTPVLAAQCTKDTKKHRKTADLNHFSHKPARMSFRRCA